MKMRGLVAVSLVSMIILTYSFFSHAESFGPNENARRIEQTIDSPVFLSLLRTYVLDGQWDEDFKTNVLNSFLGDIIQIPTYDVQTETYQNNDQVWYLPIFSNNDVLLVVRFVVTDNDVFYIFSTAYAEELTEASKTGHACRFIDGILEIDYDAASVDYLSNDNHPNQTIENLLEAPAGLNNIIITTNGAYLSNFPFSYQGSTNTCWAHCMANIVKYLRPTVYPNLNAAQVLTNSYNFTGAQGTWANIMPMYNYYLSGAYTPVHTYTWLTKTEVMYTISSAQRPALISGTNSLSDLAHHVVLIGYADLGTSFAIRVMNPALQNGSNELGLYTQNGPWAFSSGNIVYYWNNTVIFN